MRRRACFAEALGTALLVLVVVGSGVMAERLASGNLAIALLANTIATGAALYVLIMAFAPLSGAHFNPVVSLIETLSGRLGAGLFCGYLVAQILGGITGTLIAHLEFELPVWQWGERVRTGPAQWLSEAIATFGLLFVIHRLRSHSTSVVAAAVALYITAAYWFTASTSFANPAVTLARSFTTSFAGIRPEDVPAFVLAQLLGGLLGAAAARLLAAPDDARLS
jgi:glycerol uptake facilitator-like aquaporin